MIELTVVLVGSRCLQDFIITGSKCASSLSLFSLPMDIHLVIASCLLAFLKVEEQGTIRAKGLYICLFFENLKERFTLIISVVGFFLSPFFSIV